MGTVIKSVAFLGLLEALVRSCLGVGMMELIGMQVQSYHHREIFTICYLMAIGWPVFYGMDFVQKNRALVVTWGLSCASMSLFTLLPVVKVESINQM
jgi:phosphatidylinositol glycan class N